MDELNNQEKRWYKKPWRIIIISLLFIFFVFLFGFIFLVINTINESHEQKEFIINTYSEETLKKIEGTGNYSLGGKNPKVTIVEFADFACPVCKSSSAKIRELSIKYKDDIKVIFRDFPVISENSLNLSEAAYCAGEQGLFWIMHDKLFEKQGIATKEEIFLLASEIGVAADKFTACYDGKKYSDKIYSNYSDAYSLQVTGTPTFFVNGEMISGDIPLENWEKIIDYLLSK